MSIKFTKAFWALFFTLVLTGEISAGRKSPKIAADNAGPCTNLYGDINADGQVDLFDSVCYQKFLVQQGTIPDCMKISEVCADLTCDDKITVAEALATAQKFKTGKFNKSIDADQNNIPDCKEKPACNNEWTYVDIPGLNKIKPFEVRGIWGTAGDNGYFVGRQFAANPGEGLVIHYNSASWQTMSVPANLFPKGSVDNTLFAVWGTSSNNIYATSYYGKIFHFDGNAWSSMNTNTQSTLRALWGSAADNIFAVGDNGTILHFDGATWSGNFSPDVPIGGFDEIFMGVWGSSATDVYFAGNKASIGKLLHYDGLQLQEVKLNLSPGQAIFSVWGSSDHNVYVGSTDGLILHYDGKGWENIYLVPSLPSQDNKGFFSIGGTAFNDEYAMNFSGDIFHYDGSGWKEMPYLKKKVTVSTASLWGSSIANVYAGTSVGLLHFPCQPN